MTHASPRTGSALDQHPDRGSKGLAIGPSTDTQVHAKVTAALRAMLEEATGGRLEVMFTDGGACVMYEHQHVRCMAVIESLGVTRPRLSPREMQIARMVTDGATNKAIASSLDISMWTVSTHMRRIYAKLGVGSRAELVAHLFGVFNRSPGT